MVQILQTTQRELKDRLLTLSNEQESGPSSDSKPPSKASQLRFQIYGILTPKAEFDHGFPTKKDIVQVWMYKTHQKKEEDNLKKLDDETKVELIKEIRDELIDQWSKQDPPRVIDEKDIANRLKVYVNVKKIVETYDDMTNKSAYLNSSKFIRKNKEAAEGIFDVPEVIPKKRNFAEVRLALKYKYFRSN